MVIEALKAARDFIESDRQSLAESLTVNGEIVFEDDIDRGAMAEYVKVLAVIDEALNATQAPECPFEIGQRLRQEGRGISDLWGAVGSNADMPEAQRGWFDLDRAESLECLAAGNANGWAGVMEATKAKLREKNTGKPGPLPLNIKQIKELQMQAGYENAPALDLFNFLNGIRYGEAAHGITVAPEKGQK
jgi:hypothetical protein